ncbi:hypothetical protein AMR47_05850 [Leptospira interrogans]|nr:hypothetical protein AMR47_05850 [Leptospira interrogans]
MNEFCRFTNVRYEISNKLYSFFIIRFVGVPTFKELNCKIQIPNFLRIMSSLRCIHVDYLF